MNKFKEKLYRLMYGRYGIDELYKFSLAVFLVLWVAEIIAIAVIPDVGAKRVARLCFSVVITLLMVWMIFRTMSRNIYKRRRENQIYLKAFRAVKRFFSGNTASRGSIRDDAYYIFRNCTKCGSTLRLPRRVGKNRVKCPKCGHGFYVKVK